MTDTAARYRTVADRFGEVVARVPPDAWDAPSPCEGWSARDVVRHLVDWIPAFLAAAGGPAIAPGPSVDDDPAGAWAAIDAGIRSFLDDPAAASSEIDHPYVGAHRLDDAVGRFFVGDVLVHTWDLARAVGVDERLDPDAVHDMLVAIEAMDDALRVGGQYGPKVHVGPDADEQTRLIAFTGRHP